MFSKVWIAVQLIGDWVVKLATAIKHAMLREHLNSRVMDLETAKTSDEEDLALINMRGNIYGENPIPKPTTPNEVPGTGDKPADPSVPIDAPPSKPPV